MTICAGLEGTGDTYLRFFGQYLAGLPIKAGPVAGDGFVQTRQRIGDFASQAHDLAANLEKAKTSHDRTSLERQISATDRQIDQLVYELYELTDKEIKIVEDAVGR